MAPASKSAIATHARSSLSLVVALVPLVLIVGYVDQPGLRRRSAGLVLTGDIPILTRSDGPGHAARDRRHAPHHRRRHADGGPARGARRRSTSTSTARARAFGRVIRFLADVMTGVPSIVMGLFIYTIWVLTLRRLRLRGCARARLPDAAGRHPHHARRCSGSCPRSCASRRTRSAAARRARSCASCCPAAAPGIISGALLAVARAAGETAPLLFTIGFVNETNTSLFHGANTALSVQIFRNAQPGVPRAPGAGLGRGAHADRHRVHLHDPPAASSAAFLGRKHHHQ